MKDFEHYVVLGWMRNRLCLEGLELHAYAIIYRCTQNGRSFYKGGIKYLMDTLGCSKPTTIKVLTSLVDKGYIDKIEAEEDSSVRFYYRAKIGVASTSDCSN